MTAEEEVTREAAATVWDAAVGFADQLDDAPTDLPGWDALPDPLQAAVAPQLAGIVRHILQVAEKVADEQAET